MAGIGIRVEVDTPRALGGSGGGPDPAEEIAIKSKQVMEAHATQITANAKDELDAITSGDGTLGPTLDHETYYNGDAVETDFTAGHKYDLVLEYGPEVESWLIEAKFAPALVFPILDESGAVQSFRRIPRGRQVLHEWKREHLRPHWTPAIDEEWPKIETDLREVVSKVTGGD